METQSRVNRRPEPRAGFDRFTNLFTSVSKAFNWVACAALVGMMLITTIDVIGGKLFKHPLSGSFDEIQLLGLVATCFAIAYTQILRGHISVDILVTHLSKRIRAIIATSASFLTFVLFALITWQMFDGGRTFQIAGRNSGTAEIPLAPFAYAVVVCTSLMCVVVALEFIGHIKGIVKWKAM